MPATILITSSDRPVPPAPGRWLRGEILLVNDIPYVLPAGEADLAKFVQFTITDKTPAQVDQKFFGIWDKLIDMNVIAGPDPQGLRRINVRNNGTNVSETIGGWTVAGTDAIIEAWNTLYPTTNLITIDFPQYDTWTCEGTFTVGQAQEFEDTIIELGLLEMDKRRVWYVTPAGMTNIESAGGIQSGTAQQLGNIVQDGRLD
jgi:hypothetical protein